MRIPVSDFLEKYKQLYLAQTPGIAIFAYWKMKYLIEHGETHYLPEHDCYYMIRDKHLLVYHAPDGRMHLSAEELNGLDCISLPASLYDSVKERLSGFNASYAWSLRYDFTYRPPKHGATRYQAVDFDFTDPCHDSMAAQIINGGRDWLHDRNIRKMTTYAAFDPSLWFFVRDRETREFAAVSISAYSREVKQTDLDWIFVAPAYQGKGCGRFLIEETIRRCKGKSESICVGGTVDFYLKCGFVHDTLWVWAPKEGYQFKAAGIQPS